jgi:nucleoside-diphosphate-sugar epimerase
MKSGTALIIGGTGLLGRGIARELAKADWNVTLLSRGLGPVAKDLESLTRLQADRQVAGELAAAIGGQYFDLVVDCAAYTADDTRIAVEAFANRVGHYFFISTDFVYAPDDSARFPVNEEAPKICGLPYADAKLEAEQFLREARERRGFPVTILRPPHILGEGRPAGCDPVAGGRDARLPERILAGEVIPLLAGGQFLIQPVWSREVGKAIHACAGCENLFGGTMNLPGAECVTVRHYYEMIGDALGKTVLFASVDVEQFSRAEPAKAHMARHRIYETTRLLGAGYTPQPMLADAIKETLEYIRIHQP